MPRCGSWANSRRLEANPPSKCFAVTDAIALHRRRSKVASVGDLTLTPITVSWQRSPRTCARSLIGIGPFIQLALLSMSRDMSLWPP